jgi:hypothetical protein
MGSMIRSASLLEFLAMIVVPLAIGALLVYAGLRARRRATLIKSTPRSNIGIADDGYRELEGTIEAIDGMPLTSPLTRSPCVWFHAKVEESVGPRTNTKVGRHWRVLNETASRARFIVRDSTGACVVYPEHADVTPADRSVWYGATIEPTDRNPLKVGPGESPSPGFRNLAGPDTRYRYSEERMYGGNTLLALGMFTTGLAVGDKAPVHDEEAEEGSNRKASGTHASIRHGTGDPPFILSTTSRDAYVSTIATRGSVALVIAVVMLAIAGTIIWLRFS